MKRRVFLLSTLATMLGLSSCATKGIVDQGVGIRDAHTTELIPRVTSHGEKYKTFTLFISTNLSATKISDGLSKEFDAFGDAIGSDNLAVFTSNRETGLLDISAGRTLLDDISKTYGFQAEYADGPFVLLLPKHPLDNPSKEDKAAIVSFAGETDVSIQMALDRLRKKVLENSGSGKFDSGWVEFWREVLDGFNIGTGGIGNAKAFMS